MCVHLGLCVTDVRGIPRAGAQQINNYPQQRSSTVGGFILSDINNNANNLFFGVQFVVVPTSGIFINISQMLLMILTVADTNLDRTEFCTVGTGVLDGPFFAPFLHNII